MAPAAQVAAGALDTMTQASSNSRASNHGNKYLTGILLALVAVGMFLATVGHLFF